MKSYHCTVCGNGDLFFYSPLGTCCQLCLSYNVDTVPDIHPDEKVHIPSETHQQIKELERMHRLVDGRYEVPGVHGLAN